MPFETESVITDTSDGARSVYAANVHGNSDVDISPASWHDDKITWYENRGGQFALVTFIVSQ